MAMTVVITQRLPESQSGGDYCRSRGDRVGLRFVRSVQVDAEVGKVSLGKRTDPEAVAGQQDPVVE